MKGGENMSTYLVSFGEEYQIVNRSDIINISGAREDLFGYNDNDRNFDSYAFTTASYPDIDSLVTTSSVPSHIQKSVNIKLLKFIVWGILGSILAVLGFLGNTLSMVVLHRKQMRSSTSYYLMSLAIYDNCILVGMVLYFCLPALVPYTSSLKDFMFYNTLTIPFGYPLSLSAQMGSIYTCVGFTVERFIAVCRPLHAANTCTKSRTLKAIILILIWAIVYNIPRFFHYTIKYEEDKYSYVNISESFTETNSSLGSIDSSGHEFNDMTTLKGLKTSLNLTHVILNFDDKKVEEDLSESLTNWTKSPTTYKESPSNRVIKMDLTEFGSNPTFKHLYLIYFQLFFMFIIPFLIILFMNIGLIRAVRGSRSMQQSMCASAKKEHNLTVMLIALIVVFLVCQFPTIIDNILIAVFRENEVNKSGVYMCFFVVCTLMVEINAASNFLLYCFFGKKFRLILLNILGFKRKHRHVAYRSALSKSQTNGTRTHEIEVSVM